MVTFPVNGCDISPVSHTTWCQPNNLPSYFHLFNSDAYFWSWPVESPPTWIELMLIAISIYYAVVCVCVCARVHIQYLCLQTLKHTLHLSSPPLWRSSPLNHQIQYIILSIGPIEFPLPLLNELVLGESAGNEGPAALELHFSCSAIYFPQFSHRFVTRLHFPEFTSLLPGSVLFFFHESLPIFFDNRRNRSFYMWWSNRALLHIRLTGCGQHRFPSLAFWPCSGPASQCFKVSLAVVVSSILIKP